MKNTKYKLAIDRKKEIIVNSGGDNIAPVRPEAALTFQPIIQQAMVSGDRRPYLVAIIVPDPELSSKLNEDELKKNISEAVNEANKGLSQIEKIRKYIVVSEPFSTDNGMFTATMKIRRHKVREAFGETLDALY